VFDRTIRSLNAVAERLATVVFCDYFKSNEKGLFSPEFRYYCWPIDQSRGTMAFAFRPTDLEEANHMSSHSRMMCGIGGASRAEGKSDVSRIEYSMQLGILIPALISLCGCVAMAIPSLQSESAGYTGCPPEENQITNVQTILGTPTTYNASCKGKTYLCSAGHCAPVAN